MIGDLGAHPVDAERTRCCGTVILTSTWSGSEKTLYVAKWPQTSLNTKTTSPKVRSDRKKRCGMPAKLWARDDILLSDVGAHKMWIARHYHCHEPNTCLIPNGFCSMGFALPGAIAASLVHPDRRILAISGDGGFMMNVQEMETAKRLNSNIVCMVWEDGGYGLIEWKQQNEFDHNTELSFGNPDWMQLASAFGWHGHHVNNSRDVAQALENAFNEDGPSLVVLPIDYRENPKLTKKLGEITCSI